MRLFDIDLLPILCGGCGEPIDDDNTQNDDGNGVITCTSCWVNEDCPAHCNEHHPAPSFRQANGSGWECPQTGDTFWYHGPNLLADRHWGEWHNYESVLVRLRGGAGARYWIDRDDACYCESCEDYVHCDDYAVDDLCQSCYDEQRESGDYYDDGDREAVGDAVATHCSRSCTLTATHYHPITEDVTCGRHATNTHELIPELLAA